MRDAKKRELLRAIAEGKTYSRNNRDMAYLQANGYIEAKGVEHGSYVKATISLTDWGKVIAKQGIKDAIKDAIKGYETPKSRLLQDRFPNTEFVDITLSEPVEGDCTMPKQEYCHDERHETPCPLPCTACEMECNQ